MKVGNFIVVSTGLLLCLQPASAGKCKANVDQSSSRYMTKAVVGANIQPHLHRTKTNGEPYGKATTNTTQLRETLRALNVNSLRFPGGGEADNYDWRPWKKGKCVVNNVYPFSADPDKLFDEANGCFNTPTNLQFNDFLHNIAIPLAVDPEFKIILQINMVIGWETKNWWLPNGVARDWIRAIERSSFPNDQVWWELGNEQYYAAPIWPMSASKYAERVKITAEYLRKEDPNARIMIVGPPWRKYVGFLDECGGNDPQPLWNKWFFKQRSPNAAADRGRALGKAGLLEEVCPKETRGRSVAWWDVVFNSVPKSLVDGIAVHRYDKLVQPGQTGQLWHQAVDEIGSIFSEAKGVFGNNLKLGITEYNIKKEEAIKIDFIDHALGVIRMHLSLINIGADMMNLWPFAARQWKASMAVNFEDYQHRPVADYFKNVFTTEEPYVFQINWEKNKKCTDAQRKDIAVLVVRGTGDEASVYIANSDNVTNHEIQVNNLWNVELTGFDGLRPNYEKCWDHVGGYGYNFNICWYEVYKNHYDYDMGNPKIMQGHKLKATIPANSVVRFKLKLKGNRRRLIRGVKSIEGEGEDAVTLMRDEMDMFHTDGRNFTNSIMMSSAEDLLLDDEAEEDAFKSFVEASEVEDAVMEVEAAEESVVNSGKVEGEAVLDFEEVEEIAADFEEFEEGVQNFEEEKYDMEQLIAV